MPRRKSETEETPSSEIIDIKEIIEETREPLADMNLSELEGRIFYIKDMVWANTGFGQVPILTIEYKDDNGIHEATAVTFSKVLIEQLNRMQSALSKAFQKGLKVKARICKVKRYYTFC